MATSVNKGDHVRIVSGGAVGIALNDSHHGEPVQIKFSSNAPTKILAVNRLQVFVPKQGTGLNIGTAHPVVTPYPSAGKYDVIGAHAKAAARMEAGGYQGRRICSKCHGYLNREPGCTCKARAAKSAKARIKAEEAIGRLMTIPKDQMQEDEAIDLIQVERRKQAQQRRKQQAFWS